MPNRPGCHIQTRILHRESATTLNFPLSSFGGGESRGVARVRIKCDGSVLSGLSGLGERTGWVAQVDRGWHKSIKSIALLLGSDRLTRLQCFHR